MARKIIVLERYDKAMAGRGVEVRVAFWLDIPAARQPFYADRQGPTSVVDAGPDKATAAELAALDAGTVTEVVDTVRFNPGATIAAIRAALVTRYNALQTIENEATEYANYGTSWDGTNWTNRTTA